MRLRGVVAAQDLEAEMKAAHAPFGNRCSRDAWIDSDSRLRGSSVLQPGSLTLPQAIKSKLHAISWRQIWVGWTEGLLRIAIVVCVLMVAQATADWMFNFAQPMRGFLLLGDVVLLGWMVSRHGIQPWRTRFTLEKSALVVENRWPELRSSLISAVQLARNGEGSSLLVKSLLEQVEGWAKQADFRLAVPASHLRKLAGIATVALLLTAVLGWWSWPKSSVLCQRLILKNLPLPTRTLLLPVSSDFVIQPGESVEIAAKASGVVPRSGRVEIAYPGKPIQTIGLSSKPGNPGLFSLKLENVQQPFKYRVWINDGCSPEFGARILRAPLLEKVSFEQIYPAYTGLAKRRLTPGNLSLLAGSKLVIEGRSNQPLRSARIELRGTGQVIGMEIGGDSVSVRAQVTVPPRSLEGLAIVLEDRQGCRSREPVVYRVELIPDHPPEIVFGPDQPDFVTLVTTMRPRLRFEVRDDFRVKEVVLCYGSAGEKPDSPDLSNVKRIPLEMPALEMSQGAGPLAFDYVWENCEQSGVWKEGTTINYWIEAQDNNGVTGPGIARSAVRQWQILSLEAKRQELLERLSKNGEALDELSRKQEDLRNSVGEMIKLE